MYIKFTCTLERSNPISRVRRQIKLLIDIHEKKCWVIIELSPNTITLATHGRSYLPNLLAGNDNDNFPYNSFQGLEENQYINCHAYVMTHATNYLTS